MVHELIGIQDNKVDLKSLGNLPKDQQVGCIIQSVSRMYFLCFECLCVSLSYVCHVLQEVVLSSEQDPFFKSNMYENFGDIGLNIKRLVDEFQQVSKSNQNIQTIGLYAKVF